MCLFLPCCALAFLVAGTAFTLGWLAARPAAHPRKTSTRAQAPKPPKTTQPATPRICPHCQRQHAVTPTDLLALLVRPTTAAWSTRKGRGGPKKTHDSAGRYCTNPRCAYFAISDSAIHPLVADGQRRGVHMWQCQACQHHVCDTFGTFLYGKKKAPDTIRAVLSDLCHAHGIRQTCAGYPCHPRRSEAQIGRVTLHDSTNSTTLRSVASDVEPDQAIRHEHVLASVICRQSAISAHDAAG